MEHRKPTQNRVSKRQSESYSGAVNISFLVHYFIFISVLFFRPVICAENSREQEREWKRNKEKVFLRIFGKRCSQKRGEDENKRKSIASERVGRELEQ